MRVEHGGFLGLHEDFTMHRGLNLDRRINVLVYLNRDWRPEWGGQLELHSSDALNSPKHQQVSIEPLFNRMVIFNTPRALHGHTRPVACPPERARLCLSWYFYTASSSFCNRSQTRGVNFVSDRSGRGILVRLARLWLPPAILQVIRDLRGVRSR